MVIDCRFLLYLSGMALLEEELAAQDDEEERKKKTPGEKRSTSDSINQAGNQNNSIMRLKSRWLAAIPPPSPSLHHHHCHPPPLFPPLQPTRRQTQFTDNPNMIVLTPLFRTRIFFPLLTFFFLKKKDVETNSEGTQMKRLRLD